MADTLVERMIEIADRDDTTGLAADALREGSERIRAQASRIDELDHLLRCASSWVKDKVLYDQIRKALSHSSEAK